MRVVPLHIREQIIELGFQGHTRWGVCANSKQARPVVIGDFHIYISFKARSVYRKGILPPKNVENTKHPSAHTSYRACTVNEKGCISIGVNSGYRSELSTFLETCVPYPPDMFFTDFNAWKIEYEPCYPTPIERVEQGIQVVIKHMKHMQRVLDAHLLYWDIEGRPPIRQLSIEEVLAEYDTSGR